MLLEVSEKPARRNNIEQNIRKPSALANRLIVKRDPAASEINAELPP
jgi:hypothetical protein